MKRFLLFTGYAYYPGGGWEDFSGTFDTLEGAQMEATRLFREKVGDWAHVIDTVTTAEVWRTLR